MLHVFIKQIFYNVFDSQKMFSTHESMIKRSFNKYKKNYESITKVKVIF